MELPYHIRGSVDFGFQETSFIRTHLGNPRIRGCAGKPSTGTVDDVSVNASPVNVHPCFAFCVLFVVLSIPSLAPASSAVRAAASSSQVISPDLGLRSRKADYPSDYGESLESHAAPSQGPFVSLVSPRTILLPPTTAPATVSRKRFRRELLGVVQTVLKSSTAPRTMRTYVAALRSLAPGAVENAGAPDPPMWIEATCLASFGWTILPGPQSPALSTGQLAARWSYVKMAEAAVAFWHFVRGFRAVPDGNSYPR